MHKTDKLVFLSNACPKVYERPPVLHMGHVETKGPRRWSWQFSPQPF